MSTKIVNLSLPEELLKRVDAAAKREYSSRSDYVRLALLSKLQSKPGNDKSNISNKELLSSANSIIKRYKQDFVNLADK